MPIRIQNDIPAWDILEKENIFVLAEDRALHQDIRPLEICVLNLMPVKEDTELQLFRAFSNTPLQVNVTLMMVGGHVSKNTTQSHLNQFYNSFDDLKERKFDGLIITGAPVEQMPFEEVDYWDELVEIMDWSKSHVTSTLHLCWGAQAGLYHHFGLQKVAMDKKVFGVFLHRTSHRRVPLVRGFDDYFYAPHSRHTEIPADAIHRCEDLLVLAESDEVGVFLCMNTDGRQVFVMGHPEYDRVTLENEYKRDRSKGLPIDIPRDYYPDDDDTKRPSLMWRAHCNTLYGNWINYYVYQNTPYRLDDIGFKDI